MTVNSAAIGAEWFLNGLADLQRRQLQTQKELSSGIRVSSAADDPSATHALVSLGSGLAAAQTYQSNLANVQTEARAADAAITSAIALVQQAQALAVRGASSTTSSAERQSFAGQVQTIYEQVTALANTEVAGRRVFAGDDQAATRTIENPSGEAVYRSLTAESIFDSTGHSTFATLQNLGAALSANDPAGVATALQGLGDVSSWLTQQQVYYGSAEQRLESEDTSVGAQITSIQVSIKQLRDADIVQAATDLTAESTAQQAALAAQGAIPRRSLFDYLG